jgi:hypothetical protein
MGLDAWPQRCPPPSSTRSESSLLTGSMIRASTSKSEDFVSARRVLKPQRPVCPLYLSVGAGLARS